jgi:signal transduction histidine kinase
MKSQDTYTKGMEYLVDVIQQLSLAKTLEEIIEITRHAARELTGADGAAFVLRDQNLCYYVDEDAIGPLWKGKKFPMESCISGWSMLNRQSVTIQDVFKDPRIPQDAYRPTFVKSLLMAPIRVHQPIGAIGNYWAKPHRATPEEIKLLEALANSTSIALENAQLYAELKNANDYLADSLQARDEFFSIASHELRTPISAIKLQLQMTDRKLKKINPLAVDAPPPLNVSLQQVDRLANLVEALLDVSKIRLGKMDLDLCTADLTEVLEKVLDQHLPRLEEAGCTLKLGLEEGVKGECDSGKIEQILGHLISNVIRHAPKSNLEVSLDSDEDQIKITLKDNGPGISTELHQRLLQRFERGHTPRQIGGLGLGLFIVRSLIEAHQGTFNLESATPSGTLVSMTFPKFISREACG